MHLPTPRPRRRRIALLSVALSAAAVAAALPKAAEAATSSVVGDTVLHRGTGQDPTP